MDATAVLALIGIVATWILGMIAQAADIYVVDAEAGFHSLYPTLALTDFSALGLTLIGVSSKAGMLDQDEKLPRIKPALLADAIATVVGAVFGTSTTTTFVESSAGVGEGARTGLASVVTGFLFLIAIFFAPIFTAILRVSQLELFLMY